MQKFAKVFQKVEWLSEELQVYQEWENRDLSDYGVNKDELYNYSSKYRNVIEELRKPRPDQPSVSIDVGYELANIRSVTIDYRYIVTLIQNYVPGEDELI